MSVRKGFLLGAVGLLALVLLAMGISEMSLRPGHPLAVGGPPPQDAGPGAEAPWSPDLSGLGRVLLALLIWVLFPASVVYFLISAEARRRVLRDLLWVLGTMVIVYFFLRAFRGRRPAAEPTADPSVSGPAPVPPEFVVSPGELITRPPEWLVLLVSLLFLGALFAGIFWLWRALRPPALPEGDLLVQLGNEAQGALARLRAGEDLRDVVLRCYREMTRVLSEERGLRRPRAMTPREFERRLREAGLDVQPVHRLTQLFERVRYGDRRPDAREEREAQECLEAIVSACRRKGARGG